MIEGHAPRGHNTVLRKRSYCYMTRSTRGLGAVIAHNIRSGTPLAHLCTNRPWEPSESVVSLALSPGEMVVACEDKSGFLNLESPSRREAAHAEHGAF